jgi:predicted ATPase with chaperone activity
MESSQNNLTPFAAANLLKNEFDGDDPSWAIAATDRHIRQATESHEAKPDSLEVSLKDGSFVPLAPESVRATGLSQTQVESLILKFLLNTGQASGREIAEQIAIPFGLVERLLHALKMDQLVGIKSSAPVGDYMFELSSAGSDRARRYAEQCTYFGSAPVPLEQYTGSVRAQSLQLQTLTMSQIREAFEELVLSDTALTRLGEAMNLGRGLFLHGAPGNGKSSIAERIVNAYSKYIWIPRAISVGGQILRLYDSIHHVAAPTLEAEATWDQRWVRIHRPTISVGGELQLSSFDVSTNPVTGISEAPLHLKSNCGTLVIDDFGRNRFRPDELLNRMVVPLEREHDRLDLPNGRTFQVPFDCMVVFSSNLDPADLLDEAFLRRVPFKIEVQDPTDQQFHEVFGRIARSLQIEYDGSDVDYLLQQHYFNTGQARRFCHARDLLQFIRNSCEFQGRPPKVTHENIDSAVDSYLALLGKRLDDNGQC